VPTQLVNATLARVYSQESRNLRSFSVVHSSSALARIDPELLGPVRHRSAKAQIHLTVIRARAELVRARTALVNAARGLVKSYGQRLPKCGTRQVGRELAAELNAELREVLEPLLREVESLNQRIQEYDQRMEKITRESHPEVARLKQVKGGRNADRADLCPDSGRSAAVRQESRGWLFPWIKTWP
jgi:transposase